MARTANPFLGLYPFINARLNCQEGFDLKNDSDREELDKFLSEFTSLKHSEGGDDKLLQFKDSGNAKISYYVKVPSTSIKKSFNHHSTLINPLLKVVAKTDADEAGVTRQITKVLVRCDIEAVVAGLEETKLKIV